MKRVTFMMCLLLLLGSVSVTPAEAQRSERAPPSEAHDGLSLDEATARVRRDTGGRILSAQARADRGRTRYRIKVLLPSGAVRVVDVDAQSGETP